MPDPLIGGLGGQRPLGIAQLPQEIQSPIIPIAPPPVAKKKAPLTPPPLPPRLDLDEVIYELFNLSYNLGFVYTLTHIKNIILRRLF